MSAALTDVVTCFVVRNRKVLVLKRSRKVGTYRGQWSGVSGYLESSEPLTQAWTELREELGASETELSLACRGEPLVIADDRIQRRWRIHPFRFAAPESFEPRLDWENVAFKWISPDAIETLDTVPGLKAAWERVSG